MSALKSEDMLVKLGNPMMGVQLKKINISICMSGGDEVLKKAATVLKQLTGQESKFSKSKLTIRSFGIRRNQKIACSVTVTGAKAIEILEKALKVKDFEIKKSSFSINGTFGFGIEEHIDLGIKYEPSIGIFGMDIIAFLARPGGRVSKRRRCKRKVGKSHRVKPEEAEKWFKDQFNVIVLNK